MKSLKIHLAVIAALICAAAAAESVSEQKARTYAMQYFGIEKAPSCTIMSASEQVAPEYYIFNNPNGGWVIIAGDDRLCPILAHSDSGSFVSDDMPENIARWMNALTKTVVTVRNSGIVQSEKTRKAWNGENNGKNAAERKTLATALWNQWTPYNQTCNTATGKSVYAGSTATAMAIVLRYNKFPAKGAGVIPAYTTETKGYHISSVNIGSYSYNWDNMPTTDANTGVWTASQKKAVADLIFHCGAMVEMDYTPNGSEAFFRDIAAALGKYMSYNKSAQYSTRHSYTLEQWMDKLRAEIDAGRPVLYSAFGSEGGHQFVCDGYDLSTNELHFNWGYGGANNGFYAIDLGAYDLSEGHEAVFGLTPDPEGTSVEDQCVRMETYVDINGDVRGDGIVLSSGTITPGNSFTINAEYFFNYNSTTYNGAVKAALVDRNGLLKEFIGNEVSMKLDCLYADSDDNYGTIQSYSCKINGTMEFGDRIVFYFKNTATQQWIPVVTQKDVPSFAECLPAYDVTYISDKGSYTAGDWYYFNLSKGQKKISSVKWYFNGNAVDANAQSVKLTKGTSCVKAVISYTDGDSETLTKNVTAK